MLNSTWIKNLDWKTLGHQEVVNYLYKKLKDLIPDGYELSVRNLSKDQGMYILTIKDVTSSDLEDPYRPSVDFMFSTDAFITGRLTSIDNFFKVHINRCLKALKSQNNKGV